MTPSYAGALRKLRVTALALSAVVGCATGLRGAPKLWVVPFTPTAAAPANATIGQAIADVLTVLLSHATGADVVDRDHLDEVLREHSLGENALLSARTRARVGQLVAATVLVSGSFTARGDELIVTAHATDIRSSELLSSQREIGPAGDLAGLLSRIQKRITRDLREERPALWAGRSDASPIESLFFLEGLNHYHAGRYNHAMVEFLKASREPELKPVARFWMAECYLAQEKFAHAYLELEQLGDAEIPGVPPRQLAERIKLCAERVGRAQKTLCDTLVEGSRERRGRN